jgi:O-acetyl-ADP-ribose deacetylase (regulator of RNase III)
MSSVGGGLAVAVAAAAGAAVGKAARRYHRGGKRSRHVSAEARTLASSN